MSLSLFGARRGVAVAKGPGRGSGHIALSKGGGGNRRQGPELSCSFDRDLRSSISSS